MERAFELLVHLVARLVAFVRAHPWLSLSLAILVAVGPSLVAILLWLVGIFGPLTAAGKLAKKFADAIQARYHAGKGLGLWPLLLLAAGPAGLFLCLWLLFDKAKEQHYARNMGLDAGASTPTDDTAAQAQAQAAGNLAPIPNSWAHSFDNF